MSISLIKKYILIAGVLSLLPLLVTAQINGTTSVIAGQSYTYVVAGTLYGAPNWEIIGGTLSSSSQSGSTYTAYVTWTAIGSQQVKFKNNTTVIHVLNVTVTCGGTPSPSFSVESDQCSPRTVTYTGTPPGATTWYWQTSSTGTSTSNSTNAYDVTSAGTYYVRAYRSTFSCWSPAVSVSVTLATMPLMPSAPVALSSTCTSKTYQKNSAPAGVTWYWQGTNSNGTDTSPTASASTYVATSTGTYYLRAKHNTSGCWGDARSFSVTIVVMTTPDPNSLSYCEWEPTVLTTTGYTTSMRWYNSTGGLLTTGTSYTPQDLAIGNYTFTVKSYSSATGCESAGSATISLEIRSNCDQYLNSTEAKAYTVDGSGNQLEVASSKGYVNGFGDLVQSQVKDYTNDQILAGQPVKDVNDNPVLSSLTAPINADEFVYRHRFITNSNGQKYSSNDFDLRAGGQGEINNPKPVGNGGIGTLGWYYSTSNTLEPLMATSSYPYVRTYTPDGPDATTSKTSGPSADYKMGSGHEAVMERQKIAIGELDHYFKLRPHFVTTPSPYGTNLLSHVSFATTANFSPNQNVSISALNNIITATCNQTTSTPGITPIGGFVSVTPGKTYRFAVKGYKTSATAPAKLYVGPISGTNIVWPGPLLPTDGAASEAWVGVTFTVPAGVTSIKVGVLWFPALIGDQFSLTAVDLRTESPTDVIGYKYVSTNPDGKKFVNFVDADGKAIATATLAGSTYDNWSYAYYNDLGQLMATVAPKGVITGDESNPYYQTTYKYDHLGRLIETNATDNGKSKFVYSIDGKIRFSQNQEQFNSSPQRFSYSNYDYLGRPVESGEYTMSGTGYYVFEPSTVATPVANSILTVVDNNLPQGYDIETIASTVYTGVSKKLDNTRCTDFTYIKYDKSAGLPAGDTDHAVQRNIYGQVSKTINQFATTWYSYDEFGHLEWTKQSVPDISYKTVDYTYDFAGNVTKVAYQKGKADAFYHHYVYDTDQRLVQVFTSLTGTVNAAADLRANYKYYLHGPLKRLELMNGSQSIQGIDLLYHVNGSLKAINNGDPSKDPGLDGISGTNSVFLKDAFGETMHYYDNDYSPASTAYQVGSVSLNSTDFPNQYGGIPKASVYNNSTGFAPTTTDNQVRIYGYKYDGLNRFKDAQWGTVSGSTVDFSQAQRETVTSYDKNGNIQGLTRSGKAEQSIASYNYVYESNTNKLDKINDNGSLFIDYTNNAIGQVTKQDEGTGKVYNVTYNAYGLVELVKNGSNQVLIDYVYDDQGNLIKRAFYNAGVASKYTYYVRDASGNELAIYEQALPGGPVQLVEVPVYGASRIAVFKPLVNTFFYEVSDHLGNVRAVIGATKTDTHIATMESEVQEEVPYKPFKNIAYARETFSTASHSGNEVARLNKDKPAGPSISLEVSPGDTLDIDAWAYYFDPTEEDKDLINVNAMITAIASAFGGTSGAPGEAGQIYNRVNAGFGEVFGSETEAPFPQAFITVIVYDKNYVPRFAASGAVAGDNSGVLQHVIVPEIIIEEPGYVYACLYNRSDDINPVYFDDFSVKLKHSAVVVGADYYPFGLVMDGSEIDDESYRYGYQGQFSEKDLTTGWQEFELRNYDPRIGRWLSPDPYGQHDSPYVGMGNNPIVNVDPSGGIDGIVLPGFTITALSNAAIARTLSAVGVLVSFTAVSGDCPPNCHFEYRVKPPKGLLGNNYPSDSPGEVGNMQPIDTNPLSEMMKNARPMPTATISASKPNFWAWYRDNTSILGTSMEYDLLNSAYVGISTFFLKPFIGNDIYNLDGTYASSRERQVAFASTAALAMPAGRVSNVQANRIAGNAFRDELGALLQAEGRSVQYEVVKKTPFGRRVIDIEVWYNGELLGGVEAKVGRSHYHLWQRLKDWYLRVHNGYIVNVARKP